MSAFADELLILALLLFASAVLATTEIALIAARKTRLKDLAEEGSKRAQRVLEIAEKPSRFLASLQAALTLVFTTLAVYGGVALTRDLVPLIAEVESLAAHAQGIALVAVVVALSVAAFVFGELIPKRLGLAYAEPLSLVLVPAANRLAGAVAPVVWLLARLSDMLLRLTGLRVQAPANRVSEEEINRLIEEGLSAGVFNKAEKEMVAGVLGLDELPVTGLMTPRPRIVFLNIEDPDEVNWRKIVASGHSYFPVFQGNRDQVIGMIAVKALWAHSAIGLTTSLKNLLVPPLVVPETMSATHLLEAFKKASKHIALVTDEFGAIQGIVTLIDVLEAIVGDLPNMGLPRAPEAKQRDDGSWLLDATLGIAELKALIGVGELPDEERAEFQTIGGFVVTRLGRIPTAGDHFDHAGWRFEVVDMDRHRVDKILISKVPLPSALQKAAS